MKKYLLPLLLVITTLSYGQKFEQASKNAEKDLKSSLSELAELRKVVVDERIPLSNELNTLESEAIQKRQDASHAARLRDNRNVDLRGFENRIARLKDNNNYLSSLLGDYIRRFETQVHIGELQLFEEIITEAKNSQDNINLSGSDKFKTQLAVIDLALDRVTDIVGGNTFSGKAIMPDGLYEEGNFIVIGPIAYFASNQGIAGMAELALGSTNAVVQDIGEEHYESIATLANTGKGNAPIDTTLGDALKLAATEETIIEHIKKGGVVMFPILGLAAFALLIAIFKWFELSGVKAAQENDVSIILKHLKDGEKEKALAHAKSVRGPVGEMLTSAVENADRDKEILEEVIYEQIITTQPKLERMLPLIQVTAATAPLLGLLGTVTGMIKTFRLITVFGTGDAKSLSTGISEALITTEFGLIVAIPAIILGAILTRKARSVVASMEQTAVSFVNGVINK